MNPPSLQRRDLRIPDFSLRELQEASPESFAQWVVLASTTAALGFTTMTGLAALVERPRSPIHLALLGATAAACWAAAAIGRRGRPIAAGAIVLAALFLELHLSFTLVRTLPPPALLATPLLVIGAGLLLGPRLALLTALGSVAITPFFLSLSPAVASAGFTSSSIYWLITHAVVTLASWMLIALSLDALRRAIQELRIRQRELTDVIASAPDGILLLTAEDTIRESNEAANRVLGGTPQPGAAVDAALAAAGIRDVERIATWLAQDGVGPLEVLRRAPDGTDSYLELVTTRQGGVSRQLVIRDATARMVAAAEARQADERAAHARRLESVGQLAGGIAHDFNNLLMAIGGNAELLRDEENPDERATLLDEIQGAQERATTLTRQLLAFARRDVVDPIVVELGELTTRLHRLLQRVAGDAVHVRCIVDDQGHVRVDPVRIEQVLMNLVANARDAMPQGGVCTIRVTRPDASRVLLSVEDHGVGMDREQVARAIEPFFTTKPRGRGTGLGLSTVHGIVTQSGGSLSLDSAVGRGTVVRIELPAVADRSPDGDAPELPSATPVEGAARILVADDDDSTRATVGRLLRRAGYDVLLAPDGEQALRIITSEHQSITLLVTDVIMPVMNGRVLADRVRAVDPTLPILFMSGYPEDELVGMAAFDAARDFVAKPVSGVELTRRVAEKLAAARNTRAQA